MLVDQSIDASVQIIEGTDELAETQRGAVGYVFHGTVPEPGLRSGRRPRASTNLLHFAHCSKLDRGRDDPDLLWFRTIRIAKQELDDRIGSERWRWCKYCQQLVTQRLLDEE